MPPKVHGLEHRVWDLRRYESVADACFRVPFGDQVVVGVAEVGPRQAVLLAADAAVQFAVTCELRDGDSRMDILVQSPSRELRVYQVDRTAGPIYRATLIEQETL